MSETNLIPELYRKEYGKMVAVLCSRFGTGFMDEAEDIVSNTFLSAAETWGQKGIPANPVAWLYTVARNNALNSLRHEQVFERRVKKDLSKGDSHEQPKDEEIDLSPQNITDSQLQMIFAVCHPSIPAEAQVSLALRILCSFTIDEIARAFLTNKATVNKRLFRAKEKLRAEKIELALPDPGAIGARIDQVLVTLYLLFNEGYYSESPDKVLRKDFCLEAMRLTYLLTEHPLTTQPRVLALMALMCFQASRFDARTGPGGELILYEHQDSRLWNHELIDRGNQYLVRSSGNGEPTRYHLEAAIAWWHTRQADTPEKWENILQLYNNLLVLEYSPIAALNRAYAYSRVYGKARAIPEAAGLGLSGNLFYHSLLGELYAGTDDKAAAGHFEKALELAGSDEERSVLRGKLAGLQKP